SAWYVYEAACSEINQEVPRLRNRKVLNSLLPALAAILFFSAVGFSTIGEEPAKCRNCHKPIADTSPTTKHGRAAELHSPNMKGACSTCHEETGPHPKFPDTMTTPSKLKPEAARAFCLKCHNDNNRQEWRGSPHETNGLTCTSCHSEHGKA